LQRAGGGERTRQNSKNEHVAMRLDMQVIKSFHRVEITFWTAMIALMKSQRPVRIAILVAILLLCVSVAGVASLTLDRAPARLSQQLLATVSQPCAAGAFRPRIAPIPSQNPLAGSIPGPTQYPGHSGRPIRRRDPRLEGVWLVGKLSPIRTRSLPIFPASGEGDFVVGPFGLDADSRPPPHF
jgi:hypothetical protein